LKRQFPFEPELRQSLHPHLARHPAAPGPDLGARPARAALNEFLTLEHPKLAPADRRTVLDHTMGILESEDFFSERYVDSFDADQNTESTGDED
jgi:hypothetical protein